MIQFLATPSGFLSLGFLLFVLTALCERAWRAHAPSHRPARRWPAHLALYALNLVFGTALGQTLAVLFVRWGIPYGTGWLPLTFWPPLVILAISVLALDCWQYWFHRLLHVPAWGWRIHRVHHSDHDFDLTTGFRFHPLEAVLNILWRVALVQALGITWVSLTVYAAWLTLTDYFAHANVALPAPLERALRVFLVTPDMHRIHHLQDAGDSRRNYASIFSIWDRVFATYRGRATRAHGKNTAPGVGRDSCGWRAWPAADADDAVQNLPVSNLYIARVRRSECGGIDCAAAKTHRTFKDDHLTKTAAVALTSTLLPRSRLLAALIGLGLLLGSGIANAGGPSVSFPIITVTSAGDAAGDAGTCTLRQAVAAANNLAANNSATPNNGCNTTAVTPSASPPSKISFASSIRDNGATPAIVLNGAALPITSAMTISGPGSALLTISGNDASRIISATNAGASSLSGLTLTKGRVNGSGGAISFSGGLLTLTDVIVTGNTAAGTTTTTMGPAMTTFTPAGCTPPGTAQTPCTMTTTPGTTTTTPAPSSGGGIFISSGRLTLVSSTVSGNSASDGSAGTDSGSGGGIAAGSGPAYIISSTVSANAAGKGGGISTSSSSLVLLNSTLAGNTAPVNSGAGIYLNARAFLTNSTVTDDILQTGAGFNKTPIKATNALLTGKCASSDATQPAGINGSGVAAARNIVTDSSCVDPANTALIVGGAATPIANVKLGTLTNNGGPTRTLALTAGSVALAAGDADTCVTSDGGAGGMDQRGNIRPAACSIGAFDRDVAIIGAGGGASIIDPAVSAALPAGYTAPAGTTFPNGVFNFVVTGVTTPTVTVVLTLPAGAKPTAYVKCPALPGACIRLPATGAGVLPPSVAIAGNVITLTLADGDAFDTAGPSAAPNGRVGDPGGPAATAGAAVVAGGALDLLSLLTLGLMGLRRSRLRAV